MRQISGPLNIVLKVVVCLLGSYGVLRIGGVFLRFGIVIDDLVHRNIFLGIILFMVFIFYPVTKRAPKDKLPWYDVLSAVLSLVVTGYTVLFYNTMYEHLKGFTITNFEIALGFILVALVLEGARRTIGWPLSLIMGLFFIHPLVGNYFPSIFNTAPVSVKWAMTVYFISTDGIFTIPLALGTTVVFIFILFGEVLEVTGAGQFFIDLALFLVGRLRGGAAKASVISSGLFGMLSGSGIANVYTTGVFTIPLMKNSGYKNFYAGAVEAVASNGGILMPPVMGAVAFILAQFLGVTYWSVCVAAFVPAFLYYLALIMQTDFQAVKMDIKGLSSDQIPSFWKVMKYGWHYLLPLVLLIYLLAVIRYPAELACFWTTIAFVAVGLFRKGTRLTAAKTLKVFEGSAKTLTMIGAALAAAGIAMASLNMTGFATRLSSDLIVLSGGNVLILLLIAATASFVLGMGAGGITCYLMVALLITPALIRMGIQPMAAHLFALWWGNVSFITPPVAITAYAAASLAKADVMKTGWQAVKLGIAGFIIPFFFVFNPALLLRGPIVEIILIVGKSVIGIVLLSAGLEGFFLKRIGWLERIMLIVGSLLLLSPIWVTDAVGSILLIPVVVRQVRGWLANKKPAMPEKLSIAKKSEGH